MAIESEWPPSGMVQTVRGAVPPTDLGHVQPHEHISVDLSMMCRTAKGVEPVAGAVDWETLHDIEVGIFNQDNLAFLDEHEALRELALYAAAGGSTIVECSVRGMGRDPARLKRLSEASGVHIIMGTGYYQQEMHPAEVSGMRADELAEIFLKEILVGADGTDVKAGIVGEIGTTWPVTDEEKRVVKAAFLAQQETGLPVVLHPGRSPEAPRGLCDLVADVGGDITRVVLAHIDYRMSDIDSILALAAEGPYLELDMFGRESSYHPRPPMPLPNDWRRLEILHALVRAGYIGQVLISSDICTKVRTVQYGGEGYRHILRNVIPLMDRFGFSQEEIDTITHANPARLLAVAG